MTIGGRKGGAASQRTRKQAPYRGGKWESNIETEEKTGEFNEK